jgi:O-antigen/teichoic acid export membrane protein
MRLSETWRRVAHTTGARTFAMLAGLATTLLTARYLGPEARGVFVAATTWVVLCATLGHLSLPHALVFLTAARSPRDWLPSISSAVLGLTGAITVVLWGVLAVAGRVLPTVFGDIPPVVLVAAATALPALLWMENGSAIAVAAQELRRANAAVVAGAATGVALLALVVVALGHGVLSAVLAVALGHAVAAGLLLTSIRRLAGPFQRQDGVARRLVGGGLNLHLHTVGVFLSANSGVLLLNALRSTAETAYFHLALQVVAAVQILPTAAMTVTFGLVSAHGPDVAWHHQRRLLLQASAITVTAIVAGYLLAPWIVLALGGAAFEPAVDVLRLMLLSVPGTAFSALMFSQWIGRGFFRGLALASMGLAAVNVLANVWLAPLYGARGAAWAAVVTSVLSLGVHGAMWRWLERRPLAFTVSEPSPGSAAPSATRPTPR